MGEFGSLTSVLEQPQAARLADVRASLVGLLRARGATPEMGELVASVAGGRWAHQIIRFVYNPPLAEFVSLTKTLTAENFNLPFVELSAEKQALVRSRFLPAWDDLSVEQRRALAEQSDFDHDPSKEGLRAKLWKLDQDIDDEIKKENHVLSQLDRLERSQWPDGFDLNRHKKTRATCEQKLTTLKAQQRALLDATRAELPSVVERVWALRNPEKNRRGGGRKPHPSWARLENRILAHLKQNGAPAPNDGGQAVLERLVADEFAAADYHPAPSTIRRHVSRIINDFRKRLA